MAMVWKYERAVRDEMNMRRHPQPLPERRRMELNYSILSIVMAIIAIVLFTYFRLTKAEPVDSASEENKLWQHEREIYEYLRRKLVNKEDAEQHEIRLTFAVHEDPNNNKVLCHASIVEGKLISGAENPDNLGNGNLSSFWLSGSWDHNMLLESIKAVEDKKMSTNPFRWYNCSLVYMYLEDYMMALRGFEGAALNDPCHPKALDQALKLCDVLDKVKDLLQIEAKQLASLASSLPTVDSLTSSLASVNLNPSYQRGTVVVLSEGRNKGTVITGKVLSLIKCEKTIALYYVLRADSDNTCFVITVHGIRKEAIKEGDQVTILDPYYQYIYFEWKTKSYHFRSVRVDSLPELLVNGEAVPH